MATFNGNILNYLVKMKTTISILIVLCLISCDTPKSTSKTDVEKRELVPEPDKELRLAYEQQRDSLQEALQPIKENFKRINATKQWTLIEPIELFESTEGGEAKYYYADTTLEKISAQYLGETYQILTEYYLLNNALSFSFEKVYKYNRPIYWDSTAMVENNDNQVWDFEKSEITEKRSYFTNGKLFHQINSQNSTDLTNQAYIKEENLAIQTEFEKLLKLKNE